LAEEIDLTYSRMLFSEQFQVRKEKCGNANCCKPYICNIHFFDLYIGFVTGNFKEMFSGEETSWTAIRSKERCFHFFSSGKVRVIFTAVLLQ